jgi:hypothetical protein
MSSSRAGAESQQNQIKLRNLLNSAEERLKESILKYFRQGDRGMRDFLRDKNTPLVLPGVDDLFPIYKEANTYQNLMPDGISGNRKGMRPEQLHRQTWDIVGPHFQKDENDAIAHYKQSSGTGLTSNDITEIIQSALTFLNGGAVLSFLRRKCWMR